MHPLRTALAALVAVVLAPAAALVTSGFAPRGLESSEAALTAQVLGDQAPEYDGAAATGLALRKLGTAARVLHIGAHPDDENTSVFAPLALGRGYDAAYLSLTRGEGGQNSIGPELGTALGIIRSEELLSARRLDGGEQLFARAIDYGYSKSADEAFSHWPRDTLLADVVAAIRSYRPDIVISVWTGSTRDGHGQHQASGIIAREAVLAAGDPARFPEQLAAGLRPHSPQKFFWSGRYSEAGPDVRLPTGQLDPLLGRSYHQIAMASRSRHSSQDMGRSEEPGPRATAFDQVDPANPPEVAARGGFGQVPEGVELRDDALFADIDTLLSQRAASAAGAAGWRDEAERMRRLHDLLAGYETQVAAARAAYSPLRPQGTADALTRAHGTLATAAALLDASPNAVSDHDDLRFHLADEALELDHALTLAANVEVDVVSSEELVVPGQTFRLEVSVWNGGDRTVEASAEPLLPAGWTARPEQDGSAADHPATEPLRVEPGQRATRAFRVVVAPDAEPTTPYYLDPHAADPPLDLYDWPADPALAGQPFAPDPVRGAVTLRIQDATVRQERAAAWVGVDRRSGEFRRPVRVVPAVSIQLGPAVAVLPRSGGRQDIQLTARLRAHHPDGITGTLRLDLPSGWQASPADPEIAFQRPGQERTVDIVVTAPEGVAAGEYQIGASLVADGRAHGIGYTLVDYPHIAPHHLYRAATVGVRVFDVDVAPVAVGYVNGAGDGVPEALDQLGVDWTALNADHLASGDLDRFDVIITGIRAYEVRPDLVTHNQRLLDWARRGGTLIVQYNKYEFPAGDFAPWPVTMSRPHGRVTDPGAPVRVLEPEHPVLTTPNEIGPRDWEGWVQERGLYFLESWDGPLTPLLAMSDPGEDPLMGSLVTGPLGDGRYAYTGLAFFRQLPAGVPGAYRLLANLVSWGADWGPGAADPTPERP